jgi:hypothetical protein
LDPSHNTGLVIEILDKKKPNNVAKANNEVSLADMFKQRKKDILDKLQTKKQEQD